MKQNDRRKQIYNGIICLVFACFILLFGIGNLFAEKRDFSENENRYLAAAPETDLDNILFGTFDTDFETWFSDHFVFRDAWIEIKARLKTCFGAIENNNVYLAKDGRLIQQFLTYDSETVSDNISYLKEFSQDNGIRLNIMLVPTAGYGQKDSLPLFAASVDEEELIHSIGQQLADQTFIDLSSQLNTEGNNYFKTDHHWNENGAFIGYEAICDSVLHKEANDFTLTEVSSDFRGTMYSRSGAFWTKPDSIYRMDPSAPFHVQVTYESGRETDSLFEEENLNIKDKYTYYLDGNHSHVHISTDVNSGRKAVIIKDSYSHILIPYLASEYSELEIFDLRYYHDQVSTWITDQENTDVYVIYGLETFCEDTNLAILW